MKNRVGFRAVFLIIIGVAYLNPHILSEKRETGGADGLPRILEKTAKYCERLDKTEVKIK